MKNAETTENLFVISIDARWSTGERTVRELAYCRYYPDAILMVNTLAQQAVDLNNGIILDVPSKNVAVAYCDNGDILVYTVKHNWLD